MTAATARFLRGRGFPVLGKRAGWMLRPLLVALNQLPERHKRWLYEVGSGREGLAAAAIAAVDQEQLAEQVVARYPERPYPGALIGSTPGSAVHLAAALGCPLLPQTLLLPLRRRLASVDDPAAEIAVTRSAVEALVAANPDLVVHQMADPNNDRLTLNRFSYLRVKRTALGPVYRRFLRRVVGPGGTLYLVDSGHRWPTTRLGERHVYQFGGVGSLEPDEYLGGSSRVAAFLAREGSPVRSWNAPRPDGESPEAEWGFEPALADDVRRFAEAEGFRVRHLTFDQAQDLSPFVADLYRWWYERRGMPADRLFVESFVLLDPHWVLRAGAVPFWLTFNTEQGRAHLDQYLQATSPYRVIEVTLVSNGTRGIGVPGPEAWQTIFARARSRGAFAGVDVARFPSDLAVFVRYRDALRASATRAPLPAPLTAADFERFCTTAVARHGVAVS